MPISRQQSVDRFQISPVFGEAGHVKHISIRLSLKQRWDGSTVNINVCLNVAPDLGKSECEDYYPTVHYAFGNCLH